MRIEQPVHLSIHSHAPPADGHASGASDVQHSLVPPIELKVSLPRAAELHRLLLGPAASYGEAAYAELDGRLVARAVVNAGLAEFFEPARVAQLSSEESEGRGVLALSINGMSYGSHHVRVDLAYNDTTHGMLRLLSELSEGDGGGGVVAGDEVTIDVVPPELINREPSTLEASPACRWRGALPPEAEGDGGGGGAGGEGGERRKLSVSMLKPGQRLNVAFVEENPLAQMDGQHRLHALQLKHLPRQAFRLHHITLATTMDPESGAEPSPEAESGAGAANDLGGAASEWARVLAATGVERHRLVVPVVPMWFDDDHKPPHHVAERLLHHSEPAVREAFGRCHRLLATMDVLVTYHARLPQSEYHARWLFPLAKHAGTKVALTELTLLPPPPRPPAHVDAYVAPSSFVAEDAAVLAHGVPVFHAPPGSDVAAKRGTRGDGYRRGRSSEGFSDVLGGAESAGAAADGEAEPVYAIWVGRLDPDKSPALFVQACSVARASMPHLSCLVVGDGPMRGPLEELARELDPPIHGGGAGVGTTRFVGFMSVDHNGELPGLLMDPRVQLYVSTSTFRYLPGYGQILTL